MKEYTPLVSITVLVYNSSKTLLETLESVRRQSYRNIELIISDDCSQDSSVELCKKWLEENNERFVRTELLTIDKNKGIASNCNRAISSCIGEWIKGIAADDIMLPNCISDFVNFVNIHPEAEVVVGRERIYWDNFNEENYYRTTTAEESGLNEVDPYKQRDIICTNGVIFAPAVFKKRPTNIIESVYEEKYLMEDYPYYIKFLSQGKRLYFLDKEVVCYRKSSSSITAINDKLFNYKMAQAVYHVEKDLCFKFFSFGRKLRTILTYGLLSVFEYLGINKRSKFSFILYNSLRKLINKLK